MIHKFNKWLINETLGVSSEVEKFVHEIESFFKVDYSSNNFTKKTYNLNKFKSMGLNYNVIFGIDFLNINYTDGDYVATVKRIGNILNVNINPINLNIDELQEALNHEINHIYNDMKGLKTKSEYLTSVQVLDVIDQKKNPSTYDLVNSIYISQPTEIYATVSEMYYAIQRNKITTKLQFNQYLVSNVIWKNADFLYKVDMKNLWNNIISEGTDQHLIQIFYINNLNNWLKNKEIQFHKAGKEYKLRISRLASLLNITK
jgi:hypothetical protein